ncbi:tyrosine--tRNA ligase, chloroplastic/mitochondrial [Rhododendron vialii]|uniref:tyrosine--tRNA ligase, chloroplastic/mitochondrial n=1 Tax=Rhododendron vialii TaxID=182163 RepID=UPI00265E51E2|nr:tyrosine--tRNA ligase, chloroplastic/mitochondrial [Rhododendron vialii]
MAAAASRTVFHGCHCFFHNQRLLLSLSSPSFLTNLPTLLLPHTRRLRPFSSSSSSSSSSSVNETLPIHEPGKESLLRRRINVVEILEQRGLLESLTSDNLKSACSDPNLPPLRVYCGFDPTAESLHLGNLLGIVVLSWFLRCGHKAVALVGGATGRVGDPSGKSLERPELDALTLEKNAAGIAYTVRRILGQNATEEGSFVVLDNYDWWKDFRLLDFLKQVGRYARVGTMLSKESVRRRVESEQGMSFTEFTYQLLQGYDFVYLFEKEGVNVQIGGSDQWGNITAGTDLIRKILQADGAYGLTFPLLLKSDGTKFGKSEEGAIWLSPSLLSPYKFYQHFFSVPDADVSRFLKTLTFLSLEEIAELEREMKRPDYVPNTAQKRLAEEVTLFVHGEEGLQEALKATEALRPGAETRLDWETIERLAGDVPSCSMPYHEVLDLSLVDLSVSTGLLDTKSAARRLLKQGGLYLNNSRVDSEGKKVEAEDIVDGKILLLSAGKKNKLVVRIS